MSEYTRQKFREWLTTLPQDEPFCAVGKCPITTAFPAMTNCGALMADIALVNRIDGVRDSGFGQGYAKHRWQVITPRECIAIIDELEAA